MVTKLRNRLNLPRETPFDYQLAMDRLKHFRAPRDKLSRLCERGEVIQVKRGLYIAGSDSPGLQSVDPLVLSGLVYGPSYISLETALSLYGMVPERVAEITCMTSKRAKVFHTPVGRFRYRPIPERVFAVGVKRESSRGGAYLIASPEKALCDRIAQARGLSAQREVPAFLFDDLRVDEGSLESLDWTLIKAIADRYRRVPVTCLAKWMEKLDSRTRS